MLPSGRPFDHNLYYVTMVESSKRRIVEWSKAKLRVPSETLVIQLFQAYSSVIEVVKI
jgi:hypothetical protein